MKKLIARAKTKTDQILIMILTPIGGIDKIQAEITKVLQELVTEEKVAAADITKLAYYRGEPFACAIRVVRAILPAGQLSLNRRRSHRLTHK